VTPSSLHELFAASAGVAGALIGLLFVAISVEHERLTADDADQLQRVRASAALTSFTNALSISLFALALTDALGWTALVVSVGGLLFVAASVLSLLRVRQVQAVAAREALFLVGLVITFCLQLWYALRLIDHAGDVGAARGIAVMVIVCFLLGIARSWELIGGPSIGLGREVTAIVRKRSADHEAAAPASRDEQDASGR
jgi:uncharacterized membrane protein YecN with MAPEG domain